jgi:hypothetical protein
LIDAIGYEEGVEGSIGMERSADLQPLDKRTEGFK